jgi:hypothetical protein
VAGSLRAANFPRRRADNTLTPDFRGVLETNDGATILFTCHGYVGSALNSPRQLVGAMTHTSDHQSYRWINDVICAVTGVVEPHADRHASQVVLDVSQLIWEPART